MTNTGRSRSADVVNHHAADPLEPDEGVRPAADLAERDALGLGALVVAAVVERVVVVVGGVEGHRGVDAPGAAGQEGLEPAARVVDLLAVGRPDAEGPATEGDHLLAAGGLALATDAVLLGDVQAAERLVGEQLLGVGEGVGAQRVAAVGDALGVDVVAPLAGVALVGGDDEGAAADLVGGDGVGLVEPADGPRLRG